MALPTESELIEAVESADPVAVHEVRKHVVRTLATALQPQLQAALSANTVAGPYTNDGPARATRSLKNMALAYLAALRTPDIAAESLRRYKAADNMTDQVAALAALSGHPSPQREEAMAAFATQWGSDPLVVRLTAAFICLSPASSHLFVHIHIRTSPDEQVVLHPWRRGPGRQRGGCAAAAEPPGV